MIDSVDRRTAVLRLRGAQDVLVLSHKNPDGDTVGAAGALCLALQRLGKRAAMLCSDPIPALYDFLDLTLYDGSFEPRFIVAVDVASIQLFGEQETIQRYVSRANLCIDHHPSNSGYAYETLLEANAAAASEILVELIPMMGVALDKEIAECLYTGLATDTGCFKFTSTTAATHRAAAALIEAGADVEKLNERLFECRSRARVTAERMALESLEYHHGGRCALICLSWAEIEAAGVAGSELEDLTSLPRSIEGVQVGLTLRQQQDGSFKISVRTGGGIDACAIARRLGGGGHAKAAGCEISGNIDNAKHAILTEVKKEFEKAAKEEIL